MGKNELVGIDELFVSLRSTIDMIKQDHGNMCICVLWQDKENPNTFTIIISAKWLDDMTPRNGLTLITNYIFNSLSKTFIQRISRITIINTNDTNIVPFVTQSFSLPADGGIIVLKNCWFNGFEIPYAVIFESQK